MENSKFTVPSQQCLSDTKLISKFSVFSEQCSNALETGFSQSVAHIHLQSYTIYQITSICTCILFERIKRFNIRPTQLHKFYTNPKV